jgi:hypothetical protein
MAETVKKTKAPAKPKTAATGAKTTSAKAKKATATVTSIGPSPEEIARLAHKYWAERGFQHGAAEQDWLRAEQELRGIAS